MKLYIFFYIIKQSLFKIKWIKLFYITPRNHKKRVKKKTENILSTQLCVSKYLPQVVLNANKL